MSIVRIHKTGNFTVMSNYHFKEKKMSLKAKGLLSLMLSLPDDWNYSISGLVSLSKDGKDSVMAALSELEKFGYLSRERVTNSKGQFAGVEYNIYEQPQREKPVAEKPNEDKENAGKPNAEKHQQLNTNQSISLINELYNVFKTKEDDLLELYKEYILVRDNMKAPLTKAGLTKLVARSERLSKNNTRLEKLLLEAAIINGWKNVYMPKESELSNLNNDMANNFRDALGI